MHQARRHSSLFNTCLLLSILLLSSLLPARAGGLGVSPLRLNFDSAKGYGQITLSNTGREAMSVEAQVSPWPESADGQSAGDVVVNPPIVTLQPGAQATLRVAMARRPPPERERAYRLYVTELPKPKAPDSQAIGVRLRMGIPIFVAPQVPKPQPLVWRLEGAGADWRLSAHNPGNVHQRVLKVRLDDGVPVPATGSPYLLPGETAYFKLPAGTVLPPPAGSLALKVQSEHGDEATAVAQR
jgi:fimbrial chaperone protein